MRYGIAILLPFPCNIIGSYSIGVDESSSKVKYIPPEGVNPIALKTSELTTFGVV